MPAQIFGTDAVVIMLNRAFNDTSPSNATFKNQVATAGTTEESQYAFAKQYGAGYAGQTADALSTLILGNLGVLPNAALQTALKDYLTSVGVANVGIVALQLGQILSNLENATGDQAVFKAAAAAWNNEVTAAYNYSSNPANTGPSGTGNPAPGSTFTLIAGADALSPDSAVAANKTTGGDDTFRALLAGDLSSTDLVDGGAGNDTLSAIINATANRPVLKNIEVLNITGTAAAANVLNLADSSGYTQLWSKGAAATADTTFSNVDLAATVGLGNSGTTSGSAVTVEYKASQVVGAADVAKISVAGNGGALAAAVFTANDVETFNVESAGGAGVTLNVVTLKGNAVENLVVTGAKNLSFATTAETEVNLGSVDASAATGALTYVNAGALKAGFTFKAGSGADSLTYTGAATKLVVDSGAGADVVTIDATSGTKVTLGAGADILNVTATTGGLSAAAILSNSALTAALITVTDFASGSDVLNLAATGTAKITATGPQLANIAAQTSLLLATQEAAKLVAGDGDVIAFQYGADTYVFVNEGGADSVLTAGDSLIKLTGVTTLVAADVNNV